MPFALIIVGIFLLVAGVRNQQAQLFSLVKGDFSGPNNFVFWIVSILIIGAVGYIPKLKPISTGFLVLVVLVLFLTKGNPNNVGGGFFGQFSSALNGTTGGASSTNSLSNLAAQNQANIDSLKQQILATLP